MPGIQTGDRVEMHYTGKLLDGRVFDTSEGREPIGFTVGEGEVIEGINDAVRGMAVGEKKSVTLPPELAYGPRQQELIFKVPSAQLPEGAQPGAVLGLTLDEQQLPAILVSVDGDEAIVDGNPPLAGQTLRFELEIVSINGGSGSIIELP